MAPVRPSCFAASAAGLVLAALGFVTLAAQQAQTPTGRTPMDAPDIGKPYEPPRAGDDYERREVKIPMRDGVHLFTVIVVPKGTEHRPCARKGEVKLLLIDPKDLPNTGDPATATKAVEI